MVWQNCLGSETEKVWTFFVLGKNNTIKIDHLVAKKAITYGLNVVRPYGLWRRLGFYGCLCVADLPTCLLCVCLTGSVYCEEVSPDMTSIPTLPKETAYLYARFNKIRKIKNKDFAQIGKS